MTTARQRQSRLATATGLFVALVLPTAFVIGAPGRPSARPLPIDGIISSEGATWTLALALLLIVTSWERRPLSSIGLVRPNAHSLLLGAAVAGALILAALAAAAVIDAAGVHLDHRDQAGLAVALPIWVQVAVVIRAAVTEEILFRGYPIERIAELTGRTWLAALIPLFVFATVHVPFWGIAHAAAAAVPGLLLTLVYLWRRDLWINITAHALLDGSVFMSFDLAGGQETSLFELRFLTAS